MKYSVHHKNNPVAYSAIIADMLLSYNNLNANFVLPKYTFYKRNNYLIYSIIHACKEERVIDHLPMELKPISHCLIV